MKQNTTLKSFILAAALTLGGVSSALAQSADLAVPNPAEINKSGLIGSRYTQVEYNYANYRGWGADDAHGFAVSYNQPLNQNFDVALNYDWARADFAGLHVIEQQAEVALTAYTTLEWGRPYATVGAGWVWDRANPGSFNDDSFAYRVGVGMEFLPAPKFAVTPFVNFQRATSYDSDEVELGAKVSYELMQSWSLDARAQWVEARHSSDYAEYAIGASYRF